MTGLWNFLHCNVRLRELQCNCAEQSTDRRSGEAGYYMRGIGGTWKHPENNPSIMDQGDTFTNIHTANNPSWNTYY